MDFLIYISGVFVSLTLILIWNKLMPKEGNKVSFEMAFISSLFSWLMVSLLLVFGAGLAILSAILLVYEKDTIKSTLKKINSMFM